MEELAVPHVRRRREAVSLALALERRDDVRDVDASRRVHNT